MFTLTGIDGNILLGKNRKSEDTNTPQQRLQCKPKGHPVDSLTLAAKKRKQSEVTVLDYTQKRGSNNNNKKHKTDSQPQEDKKEDVQPEAR